MTTSSDLGAAGSGIEFKGFDDKDFDAYEQKKWSSNKYSLERRRAKDKLLALVHAIHQELSDDLAGQELGASDEAPSVANGRKVEAQWVFFTRNAEDRAGLKTLLHRTDLLSAGLFDIAVQHQHACLLLRLDQTGFAVGIELATKATVDRDNLAAKLKESWAKEKLIDLCQALPGGSQIGFIGDEADALALDMDTAHSWIEPLTQAEKTFSAWVLVDRTEEVLVSDAFIGTAEEYVQVFLPLFHFLAWSHDNDHSGVKDAIGKKKQDQKKKTVAFESGDRVTILSGLFAGRGGYFAEVDAKGRAKVMVGPVSVTVDVKDLKGA